MVERYRPGNGQANGEGKEPDIPAAAIDIGDGVVVNFPPRANTRMGSRVAHVPIHRKKNPIYAHARSARKRGQKDAAKARREAAKAALPKNRGGRAKGRIHKLTMMAREEARSTGLLPHEILLWAARTGKWGKDEIELDLEQQIDCAKAAAPYYAPKMSSVAQTSAPAQIVNLDASTLMAMPDEQLDRLAGKLTRLQRSAADNQSGEVEKANTNLYAAAIGVPA